MWRDILINYDNIQYLSGRHYSCFKTQWKITSNISPNQLTWCSTLVSSGFHYNYILLRYWQPTRVAPPLIVWDFWITEKHVSAPQCTSKGQCIGSSYYIRTEECVGSSAIRTDNLWVHEWVWWYIATVAMRFRWYEIDHIDRNSGSSVRTDAVDRLQKQMWSITSKPTSC